MNNKHFFSPAILALMMICCSGCGTFIGTSINTTVSPDFDVKKYKRSEINYGNETFCLISTELDRLFEKNKIIQSNPQYNPKPHFSGDLLVLVTGYEGFSLPPAFISHNLNLGYTFPRLVSVEIQDAVTKKQLLLCVYKSGFFSMCSYSECRKMILDELQKAFDESRKKYEVEQPVPAPK